MTDYTTLTTRSGEHLVIRTLDLATGRYHEVANVVGRDMACRIATLLNDDEVRRDVERIEAEEARPTDHVDLPAAMDRTLARTLARILERNGEGML